MLAGNTGDLPGTGTAETSGALERQRVGGSVTYSVVAPIGGRHRPVWTSAGIFAAPCREAENASGPQEGCPTRQAHGHAPMAPARTHHWCFCHDDPSPTTGLDG